MIRRPSFRVATALALAAVALCVPAGRAQQQQQAQPQQQPQVPVFRAETRLVPITVTVADQRGRPITDMKASEFKVFENGRERQIQAFHPQLLTPGEPVEPSMAVVRDRIAGIAPATRRTFLIVLGFGRIDQPTGAFDGAMKFIREHLLPQDLVGVMVVHRTTALTTNHRAIEQMIARYKKEHERMRMEVVTFLTGTRGMCGGPPLPKAMLEGFDRDLFSDLLASSQVRNTLDLLLGMNVGLAASERPWQRQDTFREMLRAVERCNNLSDVVITSQHLKTLAAIEYLRYLDGEKHIVVIGPGGLAGSVDQAWRLASRANDARIAIDVAITSGTGLSRGARFSYSGCAGCREIAERTGGLYTSLDDMDKALARVDEHSRSSYLLGYVPVDGELDGRYRQVRVEVTRPKVTVSYRHGYNASEEPGPIDVKEVVEAARIDAARTYGVDATDFKVDVAVRSMTPVSKTGSGTVAVDVIVDMAAMSLPVVDGLRTGQLQVEIYCGDAKERIVGQMETGLALRANAGTWDDWLKNGFRRTIEVPITAAPKFIKVIVYDTATSRVGSRNITVK